MPDDSTLAERRIVYQAQPLVREGRLVMLSGRMTESSVIPVRTGLVRIALEREPSNEKPITLIISSEGGDVFAGLSLIDAVKYAQRLGHEVVAEVWGHAQSMACDVLQACDVRRCSQTGLLMVHGLNTELIASDIKDIEAERKLIRYITTESVKMYAARTKRNAKYWREIMESGTPTYFTAREALRAGLVDEII